MSEQISAILKRTLDDLAVYSGIDAEARRNALKEALQFYVLNFIYHHPDHQRWVMYGGSALRIVHGLNRMSIDLDFEVDQPVDKRVLEALKGEIERHFSTAYGAGPDFLTVKVSGTRGLLLKFHVGDVLRAGDASNQVHVKIDLNHFSAPRTVTERRPINRDQLSFVVVTYNMSALMASKIAAIFLRGTRGVGSTTYEEKGRDIYDLLWYMEKRVTPDFDYLIARGVDVRDPRALFDTLTVRMNKVSDENLTQDLLPLFLDQTYIRNWLEHWRESYLKLLDAYGIRTVTTLSGVGLTIDSRSDVLSFLFPYATEEGDEVMIEYRLSGYWIRFAEGDLGIEVDDNVVRRMTPEARAKTGKAVMKQKQYATLFYRKTEAYLKKMHRVVVGDRIVTKIIRMTAEDLNPKEQIVLNMPALQSCDLDDLLK